MHHVFKNCFRIRVNFGEFDDDEDDSEIEFYT